MGELQDKIQSTTYSIPIYHVNLNVVWKFPLPGRVISFQLQQKNVLRHTYQGSIQDFNIAGAECSQNFSNSGTDTRLTVTKCQKIPGAPVLKVSNLSILNIVA